MCAFGEAGGLIRVRNPAEAWRDEFNAIKLSTSGVGWGGVGGGGVGFGQLSNMIGLEADLIDALLHGLHAEPHYEVVLVRHLLRARRHHAIHTALTAQRNG